MADNIAASASSHDHHTLNSCKYDVFISFRGEDTRKTFISHLYAALRRKKIEAYKDDVSLPRGEEISPALLEAIEGSKISIVVFSENYATSGWCLDELGHILKCKRERGQVVLPVFYGVDPSHVRKQKESYATAFISHEQRFKDKMAKVFKWRSALEEAGNLSGWDSRQNRTEYELIDEIVQVALFRLNNISSTAGHEFQSNLVGVEERFKKIKQLLCIDSPDIRVIGIWGMGGIGKTTLADVVKMRYASRFESCFSVDVSNESKRYGLHHLNEKLFTTLLKDRNIDMDSSFKDDRLRRTKSLVVLDNVNDLEQLDILVGDRVSSGFSQQTISRFGRGSKIILTSRDKKLLMERADDIYEVDALDSDEALELFYRNAFRADSSKIADYVKLSKGVVAYAKGNPLALKILGSHLHSRSIKEWESAMSKLKKSPLKKIHDVLKISYDALDRREQSIFLDIACFLKGEKREFVEEILDDDSLIGINVLVEKCLITIRDGELLMHDLIQEMAWEIVRQESKELGQRSRLWIAQDVYHVLKNNRGSAQTEGIFLDMSEIREDLRLRSTVFEDMENLRLLKIYTGYRSEDKSKLIYFHQGLRYLPDSLRYLDWNDYPLKSLPSAFEPQNLVNLDMSGNKLEKLWSGVKHLGNLKNMTLHNSKKLIELPDLSQAPKLERMDLSFCTNLRKFPKISGNLNHLLIDSSGIEVFHSSFESLENLEKVILSDCVRLKSLPKLPRNIRYLSLYGCINLASLESEFCELKSLEYLNLTNCHGLKNFPEISELMEHLTVVFLDGSGIQDLPSSINNIVALESLYLDGCKNLKFFPKSLSNLSHLRSLSLTGCSELSFSHLTMLPHLQSFISLNLSHCTISCIPDWLCLLSSLKSLNLSGNSFKTIPSSIKQIYKLLNLVISGCSNLESLSDLPSSIKDIDASGCTSLKTIDVRGCSLLEKLVAYGCTTLSEFVTDERGCRPSEEQITILRAKITLDKYKDFYFAFIGCLELEQSARDNVLILFQRRIFGIADSCPHDVEEITVSNARKSASACYGGNEIPKWFSHQSEGSSINVTLFQGWFNTNFLGFSASVVLELEDGFRFSFYDCFSAFYSFNLKARSGKEHTGFFRFQLFSNVVCDDVEEAENQEHVFMWYDHRYHCFDDEEVEASFDFSFTERLNGYGIKVKRCGFRMVYLQDAKEFGFCRVENHAFLKEEDFSSSVGRVEWIERPMASNLPQKEAEHTKLAVAERDTVHNLIEGASEIRAVKDCLENHGSCSLELHQESNPIATNEPELKRIETINTRISGADELPIKRVECFDFFRCLPFLSQVFGTLQ